MTCVEPIRSDKFEKYASILRELETQRIDYLQRPSAAMAAGTPASLKFLFRRHARPPDAGGLAAIPLFTVAGAGSSQRMSGLEQLGWSRLACLRSRRPRTFCWVAKLEAEPSSHFCALRWRLFIVGRVDSEQFLLFCERFLAIFLACVPTHAFL